MSLNVVPVTFVATWVSAPAPALTKMFTPETAELAFHATRRPSAVSGARPPPGFSSTRSFEAMAKSGLFPEAPSGTPLESAQ